MQEARGMSLGSAAETRRRELPIAIALTLLTGGLAAIIIGSLWPVSWAALMAGVLMADVEIYRRADLHAHAPRGWLTPALAIWGFISSAVYAVLPGALWLDGEAGAAAAAMILWVAAVFRQVMAAPGPVAVTLAGVAPPILSMLGAPLAAAVISAKADWDLAAIAMVGGGAMLAYVASTRHAATQAEMALRAATADLQRQSALSRYLFEQSGFSLCVFDRDMTVTMLSSQMLDSIDLTVERALGRNFYDLFPQTPPRWRGMFASALEGHVLRVDEDFVRDQKGDRWYEGEVRPLRDAGGFIEGGVLYVRDISAAVEARNAQKADAERLRVALEAVNAVVSEVDLDTGKIIWFGDPEPLYGQNFEKIDMNPATTDMLHDHDRTSVLENWKAILAGKADMMEMRIRKPQGGDCWVQLSVRWIEKSSLAGGRLGVMSKDVTARKRQEEAFVAAMRRAGAALRAKRALLREAMGENVGESEAAPEDTQGGVDVAEMFARLDALLQEMDARDAMLADVISSLRTAREAADHANAAKSDFLANMSHELRTPLNAIIGYTEMLLEDAEAENAGSSADLERVLNSARALLRLINEILDLSKIEAGRTELSLGEFDLRLMIEESAATIGPAAEKNANEILVRCAEDLGAAHSDGFKLNQCLLNLLANANKFTQQGRVLVTARRLEHVYGDMIEIAVKDTGIGMNEGQIKRLFQPFQQADSSTTRKYGGTGLGLAITRRTMHLLGGDVEVVSRPGQGSVFTLRFPAEIGAAEPLRETSFGDEAPVGVLSVLVVDDEADARELAMRALGRLGCAVRGAASAAEALSEVQRAPPSLVLLDINLPDADGWSVLEHLRAEASTASIPVIVLSVEDERQRALANGACEQLVKPVRRDVLAAAVARYARAPLALPETTLSSPAAAPPRSFAQTV